MNNQVSSGYSIMNPPQPGKSPVGGKGEFISRVAGFFQKVDWRTILVAIAWPFVIRLALFFLKKMKLLR
jgi:hypothetical protein